MKDPGPVMFVYPDEPSVRSTLFFRIPFSYLPASWHNTTAYDRWNKCIGIGLTLKYGGTVRFRLDAASARHLSETLSEYLPKFASPISQDQQDDRRSTIERIIPDPKDKTMVKEIMGWALSGLARLAKIGKNLKEESV